MVVETSCSLKLFNGFCFCNVIKIISIISHKIFQPPSSAALNSHTICAFDSPLQLMSIQTVHSLSLNARERKRELSEREARGGGGGVCEPHPVKSSVLPWRPVLSRFYPRVQRSKIGKTNTSAFRCTDSFLPFEHKIHISSRPCNILYISEEISSKYFSSNKQILHLIKPSAPNRQWW